MVRKIVIFLLPAVMAVSCSEQHVPVQGGLGVPIEFGVSGADVSVEVKSVLDQDAVDVGTVYVYGTEDGTELYKNTAVTRDNTGRWLPEQEEDWIPNVRYSFYGYVSSPSPGDKGSAVYFLTDDGLSISVNQPTVYDPDGMADYLLSRIVNVADGAMRPIVSLTMEHAMSLVEIRVVKSPSISNAYINRMSVKGFYRSADMQCEQSTSTSDQPNSWTTTITGSNDTEYSINYGSGQPESGEIKASDEDNLTSQIRFMAVPQQLTEDVILTVEYSVNEKSSEDEADNYKTHSEKFNLYDYRPIVWTSGHRILYTLTVDTGIHLQGTIVPWKEIDEIEGTVLPEIPTESEE